jgi:trans-aconitate methyltransferase
MAIINDEIDGERIYFPTAESNHIPHVFAYMMALPRVKGKMVADLCCGTGHGTRLLSEAAASVMGFDYSSKATAYCRSRSLPNVDYFTTDVETLPGDIQADVFTSMQGLEHLDNPKALIDKYKDKEWIVALPNDGDNTNSHHHHKITVDTIFDWFGKDDIRIWYFDDRAKYDSKPFDGFTNYLVFYTP